jgi:hypothetical protein
VVSVQPRQSSVGQRLGAWSRRLHTLRRLRRLRRQYAIVVADAPPGLGQRVAFHLHHLDLYWSRCLGFLRVAGAPDPAFLSADWTLAIIAASEAASVDILAFCRTSGAEVVRDAWREYSLSLRRLCSGEPDVAHAVANAGAAFERLRAVTATVVAPAGG